MFENRARKIRLVAPETPHEVTPFALHFQMEAESQRSDRSLPGSTGSNFSKIVGAPGPRVLVKKAEHLLSTKLVLSTN